MIFFKEKKNSFLEASIEAYSQGNNKRELKRVIKIL